MRMNATVVEAAAAVVVAVETERQQAGQRAGGKEIMQKGKQHIAHEASKFSANYKH